MAHVHPTYDTDKRLIIDVDTKNVKMDKSSIPAIAQYDHNSEYITFECERFVEGHDLSLCTAVRIHYINQTANGKYSSRGVYQADDLQINSADKTKVIFSWLISEKATTYSGPLSFVVSFTCSDEGDLTYRWNTNVCSDLRVGESYDYGDDIAQAYADVLEMWRLDLFGVADTEEARIKAVGDAVRASIPAEYTELTDDIFQTELFVRDEGHLSDLNNAIRNRVYAISLTDGANVLNMPGDERHGVLLTFQPKTVTGAHAQLFINDGGSKMYYRVSWGNNVWRNWKQLVTNDTMGVLFKAAPGLISSEANLSDLNDAENNRAYAISLSSSANVLNMPGDERHGTLLTFCRDTTDGTGSVQMFISTSGRLYMRIRWGANALWQSWVKYGYYGEEIEKTETNEPLAKINNDPGLMSCFLNVGCIGDSLASGESVYKNDDGTRGYLDAYNHSWGQYLARMTGNKYYNWSSGGRTCASWLTSSFATECFDGEHKCEAYIIGLGQNDYNRNYTIGTVSDIDMSNYNNNADSFYGNYGKIIQKIKEIQPKAKIFILTDPLETTETGGYNAAIREIAGVFANVYLVDLYTHGRTSYQTGLIAECNRAGHFNAIAYREMALIIATYIDWIMRNNISEFSEIEFIGTDYTYSE